jgi:thioredoxin 1
MKNSFWVVFAFLASIFGSCTPSSSQNAGYLLSPKEFAQKTKAVPSVRIIDVRTPAEYAKGHLQGAVNIDWNGNSFEAQIMALDKSKPVFVYCHSGRRSGLAADKMRADGFKQVYEMDGGITKWEAAGLPEAAQ